MTTNEDDGVLKNRDLKMASDRMQEDIIGLRSERVDGEPLQQHAMHDGRRLSPREALTTARERFAADFQRLPPEVRAIRDPAAYPVRTSRQVQKLQDQLVQRVKTTELREN